MVQVMLHEEKGSRQAAQVIQSVYSVLSAYPRESALIRGKVF